MNWLRKFVPTPLRSTNPDEKFFSNDRDRALHYFYKSVALEMQNDALHLELDRLRTQGTTAKHEA